MKLEFENNPLKTSTIILTIWDGDPALSPVIRLNRLIFGAVFGI
jgi:hypothetical protein